jgi:heme/copper-type cytochrome/quinol oxidase subunit 2
MVYAFLAGLVVNILGVLISLWAADWHVSFALSAAAAAIAIFISSMIVNISMMVKRRGKRHEDDSSLKDGERLSRGLILFAFPNIITAVILYLKLYR